MNKSKGISEGGANPYRTDTSLPCFALGLDQSPKLAMLYSLFKVAVQQPTIPDHEKQQQPIEENQDSVVDTMVLLDQSAGERSFMTGHSQEEAKQASQDEED